MTLFLASKSPRRKALLAQLGVEFQIKCEEVDETPNPGESAAELVQRLALAKAQAVLASCLPNDTVLGADTIVVCDQQIFGKPQDFADAQRMLSQLSDRTHQVMTAVAVCQQAEKQLVLVSTDVQFKPLSKTEILNYWHSGEPQDKAGSYAIQGLAGAFVKKIHGSYSAVVGLPLFETQQILADLGIESTLNPQSCVMPTLEQ